MKIIIRDKSMGKLCLIGLMVSLKPVTALNSLGTALTAKSRTSRVHNHPVRNSYALSEKA